MSDYVLEILDGDRAGDVLPLPSGTLRIGRKPGNDLVLSDEKTSGVHAEVVAEDGRHVLRDLGSTNGSFLDGKRITEIVLSAGDVVTIGRTKMKFRAQDDAKAADAGDLTVRRLDAGRLQRRSGSLGVLAGLVVVVLGAGGWFWWQGQEGHAEEGAGKSTKPALQVPGNRLAAGPASCEVEEGWNLRAAGVGFRSTTQGHTGSGGFEATRGDDAEAQPFAIASLQEPLPVIAGRTLTLSAHVRSEGGAQICVRGVCSAANEQNPFRFRTGSPLAEQSAWQRIETVIAIPAGCDRLQLEVVAVLPAEGAAAWCDDVAVTEGGTAVATEEKLAESSQTLLATGAAFAVRSTDPENPATLLQILPSVVPPQYEGLHRAGHCVLSDLGATVVCKATERTFEIEVKGSSGMQLIFDADAAGQLMIARGDDDFTSTAAESEFTARRVLLGDRLTRAMLHFTEPVTLRGEMGGGLYRLHAGVESCELALGFRAERRQADDLLRDAKARHTSGQPGQALDLLRRLARAWPMDSEVLSRAQALRTQILAEQADVLGRLQQDLDESTFFDTRGGFERVVLGVAEVITLYGEENLEDAAGVAALRERAATRLQQIDAANKEVQRQRLLELAKAFAETEQAGLAKVVEAYVAEHLK